MKRIAWICIIGLLGALPTGCVGTMSEARIEPGTAPDPGTAWEPPASVETAPPPAAPPEIPADLLESIDHWGLSHLIDLALRTSPQTRVAWASARSAAAGLGSQKGSYYPAVGLQANYTSIKGTAVAGQFTFQQGSYGADVILSYLLLDFGGRSASVEMARQALIAADWTHNAAIQDVMLEVEQAYYQYLFSRALLESEQAAVKEAQASLDAADGRREAGVGTIAEALQAKTVLSQSQLELATTEGVLKTIKGVLATAVGLPANTDFDVAPPADDLPMTDLTDDVDTLIEEAQRLRPDLAAARSRVREAEARVTQVKSAGRPSLVTNWDAGAITYTGSGSTQETYLGTLTLRVPLFNGLTQEYDELKAKADVETERARLDSLTQTIISQVWSSYYRLQTAGKRLEATKDLIDSAQQAYDVTRGRYQAGVGSILDLLTSQRALAEARARRAQADADLRIAMAQLAHDTGTLLASPHTDTKGTP